MLMASIFHGLAANSGFCACVLHVTRHSTLTSPYIMWTCLISSPHFVCCLPTDDWQHNEKINFSLQHSEDVLGPRLGWFINPVNDFPMYSIAEKNVSIPTQNYNLLLIYYHSL